MAVDQSTGDVYVGDGLNYRIDEFASSGKFLRAWGLGVADGAQESQICTTVCQRGIEGNGAGSFGFNIQGVAVDNDPVSPSHGDVYVVDFDHFRVEEFDSSGKFLRMFGGHVNETTSGDVCLAGEACRGGTSGSANGEFEWEYAADYIAVGPGGKVYVGDQARVQVFDETGAWQESVSLSGLSATGKVTALAVDASGDVFVKDGGVPGVREFEPGGVEKAAQFDAGSETVNAIATDASGDLLVSDWGGNGPHLLEYGPLGEQLESFGSHLLTVTSAAMALDEPLGEVLVFGSDGPERDFGVWGFALPAPGPVVEAGQSATPGLRGAASLEAFVNPEGYETTYHYEYVEQSAFAASGYASATSTASASISNELFEDHTVSASLSGLTPGATYHYRLVATNSKGSVDGPDQTFTETPAALIEGPWSTDVSATSATIQARIDPLGASTTYRLEYGSSASYGHVVTGSVGEGMTYVLIDSHRQDLEPGAVYHYRVVAENEVGTVESADRTLTTQIASVPVSLPDGRQWEQVTPPNKRGALVEIFETAGDVQAASDGSAITYVANEPVGEGAPAAAAFAQTLSMRKSGQWTSQDIDVPRSLPPEGITAQVMNEASAPLRLFSSDLGSAVVEPPTWRYSTPLSPDATERTLYVRDNANGEFLPLVTPSNVPPGTKFGGEEPNPGTPSHGAALAREMHFRGATPDLKHIVFETPLALTESVAALKECTGFNCPSLSAHLYEWSAGKLGLVDVRPDGKPIDINNEGAFLGVQQRVAHAISNDGRRVVWSVGLPREAGSYSKPEGLIADGELFIRDMTLERTYRIGGRGALFETMSGDGSKVFYIEGKDLREFDIEDGSQTDLTSGHGEKEVNAGVRDAILGASEDGSSIYIVARSVLAPGAIGGEDNLYLLRDSGSGWATTYVATLSHEDEPNWFWSSGNLKDLRSVTARVSPDGRYLTFMSNKPLTGYDNADAITGRPDEEVYLYDAGTGRLSCASCDPTGERPTSVSVQNVIAEHLLVEPFNAWGEHGLAGSLFGWRAAWFEPQYQPRFLSNSGRLFFQSPDALVSQDTNGLEDVYEYEPAGVGSCRSGDATFQESAAGCVSLISSGTAAGESMFYDASENGDDVFFTTVGRLTPSDYDTTVDLYDAHVCSASSPCASAPVAPPPCSSGDSCKAAPTPQPEIFGPAPSATFSGTGNVSPGTGGKATARGLTRAERLRRALRQCDREKRKKRRLACRRRARQRLAPHKSHKAATSRKGSK